MKLFIIKLRNFIFGLSIFIATLAVVYALVNFGSTEVYIAQESTATTSIQTIEEDPVTVSEAERMLAEATAILNEEEARIEKEIADLEARIEEINKIRASF